MQDLEGWCNKTVGCSDTVVQRTDNLSLIFSSHGIFRQATIIFADREHFYRAIGFFHMPLSNNRVLSCLSN
jgi:hypothetical protein